MQITRPFIKYLGDNESAKELTSTAIRFSDFNINQDISLGGLSSSDKTQELDDGSIIRAKARVDPDGNVFRRITIIGKPKKPKDFVVTRIACRGSLKDNKSYIFGPPDKNHIIPDPIKMYTGSAVSYLYASSQSWLSTHKTDMVSFGSEMLEDGTIGYTSIKINNEPLVKIDPTSPPSKIQCACTPPGGGRAYYAYENSDEIHVTKPLLDKHKNVVIDKSFFLPPCEGYVNIENEFKDNSFSAIRFFGTYTKLLVKKYENYPFDRKYPAFGENCSYNIISWPKGYLKPDEPEIEWLEDTHSQTNIVVPPFHREYRDDYNIAITSYYVYLDSLYKIKMSYLKNTVSKEQFPDYQFEVPYKTFDSGLTGYIADKISNDNYNSLANPAYQNSVSFTYNETRFSASTLEVNPIEGSWIATDRIEYQYVIDRANRRMTDEEIILADGNSSTYSHFTSYRRLTSKGSGRRNMFSMNLPDLTISNDPNFDPYNNPDNLSFIVEEDFNVDYLISDSHALDIGNTGINGIHIAIFKTDFQNTLSDIGLPYATDPIIDINCKLIIHYRGNEECLGTYRNTSIILANMQYAYDGKYVVICGTIKGGLRMPNRLYRSIEYTYVYESNPDKVLADAYRSEDVTYIIDTSLKELNYKVLDYRVDSEKSPLYFAPIILKS